MEQSHSTDESDHNKRGKNNAQDALFASSRFRDKHLLKFLSGK